MKGILINAVIFVAGAGIGSAVTWKVVKTKYEQIANEEIKTVREIYFSKDPSLEQELKPYEPIKGTIEEEADNITQECKDLIDRCSYISNEPEEIDKTEKGGLDSLVVDKPYVISPEEFGEFEDYNQVSLMYYADKVLVECFTDEIVNAIDTVGLESLEHFGEYEDDSVHVRNDARKCDYEILLDQRNYSDLSGC